MHLGVVRQVAAARYGLRFNNRATISNRGEEYCALHCLLPHDAMHKRGLCRRAVAGWLSVTFVYCVETAKDTALVTTECE